LLRPPQGLIEKLSGKARFEEIKRVQPARRSAAGTRKNARFGRELFIAARRLHGKLHRRKFSGLSPLGTEVAGRYGPISSKMPEGREENARRARSSNTLTYIPPPRGGNGAAMAEKVTADMHWLP